MNASEAVLLAVVAVPFVGAVYAAATTWARMMQDNHGLRLADALEGQGIQQPWPNTSGQARELACAARRCVTCVHHARCETLLAKRDWQTLHAICPNASYMDQLRERARS